MTFIDRRAARVLLIDADMRRPGLHRIMGVENNIGLSHLLVGQARVREAVQRVGGMYYIVDSRLEPRAVHQATLHRAGGGHQAGSSVFERTGEA